MSRKFWGRNLSFKLSRRVGWRLAVILIFALLGADLRLASAQTQDEVRAAAEKIMDEARELGFQNRNEAKRLAVKKYEEALQLWRRIGDRGAEAKTLQSIGFVYSLLEEQQKGIDYYNQSLAIHRAVGDREKEASMLSEIASAYAWLREWPKALDFYNQALAIHRAAGDREKEAHMLGEIAVAYLRLGEGEKALDFYNQALAIHRAAGDHEREASTLKNIAMEYAISSKAIDYYSQALAIYRKIGDRFQETSTLESIGQIYYLLREKQKALDFYNQALAIHRAAGDREKEASALSKIAEVYVESGEWEKGLDFYNQALAIHRVAGDHEREAGTLDSLAAKYLTSGEKRKAIDYYSQALAIYRKISNRFRETQTLGLIGWAHYSLDEIQKGLDYYNQALAIHRAAGDHNKEADTLNSIAMGYVKLGEKRKAIDYSSQALAIQRRIGDRLGESITLESIGWKYFSLGEKQKGLDFYNQSLAIHRAARNRQQEASTIGAIALEYAKLGEYREAIDYESQALAIHRAAGDRFWEKARLESIGRLYWDLGEDQKAIEFFYQALAVPRAMGDRVGEAFTLSQIGSFYLSLGESQKALDHYNQVLAIYRAVAGRGLESLALKDIGDAYHALGEKQKALDLYNQALTIERQAQAVERSQVLKSRFGEAAILNSIGSVYNSLGEKQKALDYYNQALAIHRAESNPLGEGVTLHRIGLVYHLLGEKQKALDLYNQALPLIRTENITSPGVLMAEAGALASIAQIKRDLGHFDEARSQIESALKIIESIGAKYENKELRASFFGTAQRFYEIYIDLLMRMSSRQPDKGHMAEALEASERSRARSLIESLREARADIRRGGDPKLLEQEKVLPRRLNAKAEEALRLSATGKDETELAALRREMDALTIELQQVQTQIRQSSSSYAALTQPQPITLGDIQRQALDADTLLLEYSLGKARSYLWAVTPATINSYELPKQEEIEAAAQRVYELLSKAQGARGQGTRPGVSGSKEAGGEYLAAATNLSRMLLGPVAGQLGKKRLLIVADGMLHYIPFGALPIPETERQGGGATGRRGDGEMGRQGDRATGRRGAVKTTRERDPRPGAPSPRRPVAFTPLIVEHEIVNLPSASTIVVLRRQLAGRKPAPKMLAALADPVFTRDDERIKPVAISAEPQTAKPISSPLNESAARKLVQIAGGAALAAPGDLPINRLPFTRQEAEAIMALAPAGSGMKALDFQASRATVTDDRLSQYRYIHFATHGLADSERPELSTIVLSRYDEQGRPQDGFLRAHEVYNLELPAELVTLSACETGLGKLTRGEGLVSLTRGFMYAGAARVVVSLWSVSDKATAELMEKFYRRMLVNGERPAAALRAAQVEMWRDKRWEAPYYWAAFTLQGEWR